MYDNVLLVSGGRDFYNRDLLFSTCLKLIDENRKTFVINGGARGADSISTDFAKCFSLPYHEMDAEWHKFDLSAGCIRNSEMLNRMTRDFTGSKMKAIFFWDGESSGTHDMLKKVKRATLNGYEIDYVVYDYKGKMLETNIQNIEMNILKTYQ